jgi:hypothetical protein
MSVSVVVWLGESITQSVLFIGLMFCVFLSPDCWLVDIPSLLVSWPLIGLCSVCLYVSCLLIGGWVCSRLMVYPPPLITMLWGPVPIYCGGHPLRLCLLGRLPWVQPARAPCTIPLTFWTLPLQQSLILPWWVSRHRQSKQSHQLKRVCRTMWGWSVKGWVFLLFRPESKQWNIYAAVFSQLCSRSCNFKA